MQEGKSLLAMKQLLDHTVEVLALWKVLCDHQLHLLGPLSGNRFDNNKIRSSLYHSEKFLSKF
jgi:nuclear pore complex protein Nup155